MTKTELFLELAKPNKNGVSRWVDVSEFTGKYAELVFGNGASWARKESKLAKEYIVEFCKTVTSGKSIKRKIKSERCVVLGTSNPEVDHKNGMKNEARVMRNEDQRISDFQPLSKAANDAKRQFCKECIRTGIRYDAKKLGYPMSYYKGGAKHNNEEGDCIGCYWYDPLEFKKHLEEKK